MKLQVNRNVQRLYNAVNNVMENESSEIAGTLMTLKQHF